MLIYQLTNITPRQMMGYVIKTDGGKVIVIDGGWEEQTSELYRILEMVGKDVDIWFLTHEHIDHFGAIKGIIKDHKDVTIKKFYTNTCSEAVVNAFNESQLAEHREWRDFVEAEELDTLRLEMDQILTVDNVTIEVLGIDNPDIFVNNSNNQSVVLKFIEGDFTMLFLSDLGVDGGVKLLQNAGDRLKCRAVQMAHHGQYGVDREVYEKVAAKYAFWPTPRWLWDNTEYLGKGEKGSGPFDTPKNIKWMEELGAINVTSFEHTVVFDTKTEGWQEV